MSEPGEPTVFPDAPEGFDPTAWQVLVRAWDSAPMLVSVVTGPEHVMTYVNQAVEKLFGGRPLGIPMKRAFPGMDLSALSFFDEVLHTGRVVEVPVRRVAIRDLGGGDVVMRYVLSPLVAVDGSVIGVISTASDVTAEARVERHSLRTQLLSDISDRMNATEDPAQALQTLSAGLVPDVADVAAVYVVGERERVGELSAPRAITLAEHLRPLGEPPAQRRAEQPYLAGLERGTALVIAVDSRSLGTLAPAPAMRTWLTEAQVTSIAVVPLLVAGTLTGAVVLATSGPSRPYDSSDLPFLADVAARAGAAITHVRSVGHNQQVALDLQRALLPAAPPGFTDRQVAGRYLAGVVDVEVGGDWWDVADIGGGQTALGVGDVSGRGLPAAVVMGQARAAMRAMSFAQLGPIDVLGVLDEQLAELVTPKLQESISPPRFVTALYGVFEPRVAAVHFANAGHPPPIVRRPDGHVHVVQVPPGPPLGLRLGGWHERSVDFPPGSIVAMFTDGLVESRDQDIDDGLALLADALGRYADATDLDDMAGSLIQAMARTDGHIDDVALLLLRTEESAYPVATLDVTITELSEIAAARSHVTSLLDDVGVSGDVSAAARQLVDELAANALEHGSGPADLHVHATGVKVVIEVTDQVLARPRQRRADLSDERGRGLAVTSALSSRWGARLGPRGKTVWAEIELTAG